MRWSLMLEADAAVEVARSAVVERCSAGVSHMSVMLEADAAVVFARIAVADAKTRPPDFLIITLAAQRVAPNADADAA